MRATSGEDTLFLWHSGWMLQVSSQMQATIFDLADKVAVCCCKLASSRERDVDPMHSQLKE